MRFARRAELAFPGLRQIEFNATPLVRAAIEGEVDRVRLGEEAAAEKSLNLEVLVGDGVTELEPQHAVHPLH